MILKSLPIKVMAVSAAVALLSLGFAGCKKAQAASASSNGRSGFNSAQMQQQEKTELAALVKAGTITQAQSDKIYTALSSMSGGFGQGRGGQSGSGQFPRRSSGNGAASGGWPTVSGFRPESRPSAPSGSSGTTSGSYSRPADRQGFDPLSSLVTNGTITQAQADAVVQALFGNRFGGGASQASAQQG